MSTSAIAAALAAGATLVTPNKRLARTLAARHDAAMLAEGRGAWPAARVLPWPAWLTQLWRDAGEAAALPPSLRLLAPVECDYLWHRIVGTTGLLDTAGAATLAAEAWEITHAWGAGGTSWRGWRQTLDAPPDSDPAAFAAWAERYHQELDRLSATDMAALPDRLAAVAAHVPAWRSGAVVLAGFLELAPQQVRLVAALRTAGADVRILPAVAATPDVGRVQAATPRDEVRLALGWARAHVDGNPGAAVGIAIDDLAGRRAEVLALAEDVLCPTLQAPGHAGAPRPYTLSLGAALSDVPMVASALALLALAHGPVPRDEAAAMLRAPYLPGAWTARASCERDWLEESRATLLWDDVVGGLGARDPALAARLRAAREPLRSLAARPPRQWVNAWRDLLGRCGWPGERPLVPAEFEARNAWEELLEQVARIGTLESQLPAAAALGALRTLAGRSIFQPESGAVSITILGVLEAAGLPFDALWVTGLSAQRWPRAPQPNPFLPLRWQRERGVPRASAARELGYARALTATLVQSAPRVVLSHPATIDAHPTAPSSLIPADARAFAPDRPPEESARIIAAAAARETLPDACAPALPAGPQRGGAGLIAAQSDCPFRAVAAYRLRAQPWPLAAEGLNYEERGRLVHAALAAFWTAVPSQAALVACAEPALRAHIDAAVDMARAVLPAARWRQLPPAVAAAEAARIAQTLAQWIAVGERARPPFAVDAIERSTTVTLAGLTLTLRLDRVDRLADGGRVVIDYKTGRVDAPPTWFLPRPRAPQLGLYALALREGAAEPDLRAVAYARLKAGEIAAIGVTGDAAAWPGLTPVDKLAPLDTWAKVEAWWGARLPALAQELREGVAAVTPRDGGAPCRTCGLQPLCRIGEAGGATEGDDDA